MISRMHCTCKNLPSLYE
ncbi:Putative protein of unknown function [Podospora comata]|uniref:Uncharacterized protein n=1 Tax=Podospora comata TaxID=48703 RepID=A0ABY6RT29_PODCO|nr:Putative protein of unknown function [Podospora comata]